MVFNPFLEASSNQVPMDKQGRPDSPDWDIWVGLQVRVYVLLNVKFKFRRLYHMFYHMEAIFDRSGDCSGNGFRLIQVGSKIYCLIY